MAERSPRSPEAIHAVSRLLNAANGGGGPSAIADTLVDEARALFSVRRVILLSIAELEGSVAIAAMDPPGDPPEGFLPLDSIAPAARRARSTWRRSVRTRSTRTTRG